MGNFYVLHKSLTSPYQSKKNANQPVIRVELPSLSCYTLNHKSLNFGSSCC